MTRDTKRSFKRWALAGCAASVLAIYTPAFAQSAQVYEFDIEGKELGQALTELGMTTGQQVLFKDADINGATVSGLEGSYTTAQAIDLLLDGTGIDYRIDDNGTLLVGRDYVRVASAESQDVPVAVSERPSGAASGPSGGGQAVPVTGEVKAFGSEANLKGAQVEIVETGQKTATDNLGRFRFSSVAPGEYTLRITYLGRDPIVETITVDGDGYSRTFAMGSEGTLDTIYVYGSRSARAQSLNQERTAENSTTVLASDFLGQFDGTNVAETLRRAPGIAFEQSVETGDGTNVIVRGVGPDFNQVTLNGVRLAEGTGIGRSPDLGNILTESISKVTISKTLLPSQDSSGAGGLIDIETKTPLDRARRFASASIQDSQRGDGFGDERQFSGILSGKFGVNDQFGLSASVQFVDSTTRRISYSINRPLFGPYLPLDSNGVPATFEGLIDPRTPFPFEEGEFAIYPGSVFTSLGGVESTNLTGSLSAAWDVAEHTTLYADYTRSDVERDSFNRETQFSGGSTYELLPVDALGGEIRGVLVGEDVFGFQGVLGAGGQNYTFTPGQENVSDMFSFRGQTDLNRMTLNYSLGYALGESRTASNATFNLTTGFSVVTYDRSLFSPEGLENTVDGRIVGFYAPLTDDSDFILPLLSQTGFDFFNNPDSLFLLGATGAINSKGENERLSGKFDVKYDFDNQYLKYVEVGAYYERADFRNLGQEGAFRVSLASFPLPTIGDAGLDFSEESLRDIGVDGGFLVISEDDARVFLNNIESYAAAQPEYRYSDGDSPNLDLLQQAFTREESLAVYLQSRVDVGKLEIVGGVRLDNVKIKTRNLSQSNLLDENGVFDLAFRDRSIRLVDQEVTQTVLLPRIAATYRVDDNMLFRAGYSQSVSRPQIQLLSSLQNLFVDLRPRGGPNSDSPTIVASQGNPDLDPSKTTSYDLSFEKYFDDVGQIEVALFYKDIDNLIESNVISSLNDFSLVEFPDDPALDALAGDAFVSLSFPVNNENPASIWGFESTIERQLTFLPGFWDGFGVLANFTYTDSEKVEPFTFFNRDVGANEVVELEGVAFSSDPNESGTVALTYNKHNIDATIGYTFQGRRLNSIRNFRLDRFTEPNETLDVRFEYRTELANSDLRFWFEGSDLLRSASDSSVETTLGGEAGTPRIFESARYFGGRELTFGVSATF